MRQKLKTYSAQLITAKQHLARVAKFLGLLMCGIIPLSAHADDYPSKPIRIVVPFPAGSSADVGTRQVAQKLSEQMRQSVIVDNRPGANGVIGAQSVAKARPDGYTLLYVTSHVVAVNPHIIKNLGFDALKDFVPITIAGSTPALLVVSTTSPYRSVQELIAAAKAAPGKLTYSTSGEGSPQHIMGEKLMKRAGIKLIQVPYKGETLALQDLIAGEIDFAFGFPAGTMPHVRSGKLRALGITSEQRLTAFPDVPTLMEAGLLGYSEVTLGGYLAPRGTAPAIVKKLNDEIRTALLSLKREIAERGGHLIGSSPEQATTMLKAEYVRYGKLVKELGLKPQ
jgi:tripartite-type tricarboxylate transporter receptor subunit TctC